MKTDPRQYPFTYHLFFPVEIEAMRGKYSIYDVLNL